MWYKNIAGRFFGLVTKHACDRQTERQNYDSQDRASMRRAVKIGVLNFPPFRNSFPPLPTCPFPSIFHLLTVTTKHQKLLKLSKHAHKCYTYIFIALALVVRTVRLRLGYA